MKFKFEERKKPMFGNTRTVKKFAWFPVYCKDHVVWLEFYSSIQQAKGYYGYYEWREIDRQKISRAGK